MPKEKGFSSTSFVGVLLGHDLQMKLDDLRDYVAEKRGGAPSRSEVIRYVLLEGLRALDKEHERERKNPKKRNRISYSF